MTSDSTAVATTPVADPKVAESGLAASRGPDTITVTWAAGSGSPVAEPATPDTHENPAKPKSAGRSFASASVPRHLLRGAVGFGAIVAALALVPVVGMWSLVLAPVGIVALRGCPMCWVIGLMETVSAGRLRRQCTDGQCELVRAK